MVPVTFAPKFRPETIAQFLQERDQLSRMEAMLAPPPAPSWMDPRKKEGQVTREEWLNHQDEQGNYSNWASYASEMLDKAGAQGHGYFRVGATPQQGIRNSQGKNVLEPNRSLLGVGGPSVGGGVGGKMPTAKPSRQGSGNGGGLMGLGMMKKRRGAFISFGGFSGGR